MDKFREHCLRAFMKVQLRRMQVEPDEQMRGAIALDITDELVRVIEMNFCKEDSRESSGGTNHHEVGQSSGGW